MKKGVALVYAILTLALLASQEARTDNKRFPDLQYIGKVVKPLDTVCNLVDTLQLYLNKVDSATGKTRGHIRVLKDRYQELRKLDSGLVILTTYEP